MKKLRTITAFLLIALASVSYGHRRSGAYVIMLDEGDIAFRASRGNFGLGSIKK